VCHGFFRGRVSNHRETHTGMMECSSHDAACMCVIIAENKSVKVWWGWVGWGVGAAAKLPMGIEIHRQTLSIKENRRDVLERLSLHLKI
jgi:hypothetical protein